MTYRIELRCLVNRRLERCGEVVADVTPTGTCGIPVATVNGREEMVRVSPDGQRWVLVAAPRSRR